MSVLSGRVARRIAVHAQALGYVVDYVAARESASRYVYCRDVRDSDGEVVRDFKIRVSDHAPCYSYDIDVHDAASHERETSIPWWRALIKLADAIGQPVPSVVKAAATREANVAAARRAALVAAQHAAQQAQHAAEVYDQKVRAALPDWWLDGPGKAAREARRIARRRYDELR